MTGRTVLLALLLPIGFAFANGDGPATLPDREDAPTVGSNAEATPPPRRDAFAFMPRGGGDLLPRVYGTPEARAEVLARTQSVEDWQADIAADAPDMPETEARTLAAYLANVTPTTEAELPPDGRTLALRHCQSCHSLFTGYLMQRRDRQAWLGTFASPFHGPIDMSAQEKAIFADYSAINMPMQVGDVPAELRF
ncbi:hypothetical protein GQE99_02345 [Maritimibacter sp. DP07]|uniref:Cytochrome c domain-containing protein n=1 Tax=Maritimibacter harenae TaxID=2606218 RepID=A0A845LVM0_9RHOB|nr:hypothetical protein [Maritimibacter harenae]MZR11855.1 hypothetical protein [Maritimibacter harenae]